MILSLFFISRLRRGDFRYTTIQRSNDFLLIFCSRLRRGDFRYTTILFKLFSSYFLCRASAEAILGTQRYFSNDFLIIFVRASGGAILRTQRYFIEDFL